MTKKQYDNLAELIGEENKHLLRDPLLIIEQLINRIINTMYMPVPDERQFIKSEDVVGSKMNEDAINWGNLQCTVVTINNERDGYKAIIEEADPGAYNLKNYIENLLQRWGWNVEIQTEW